jgi:hypothetical protein
MGTGKDVGNGVGTARSLEDDICEFVRGRTVSVDSGFGKDTCGEHDVEIEFTSLYLPSTPSTTELVFGIPNEIGLAECHGACRGGQRS